MNYLLGLTILILSTTVGATELRSGIYINSTSTNPYACSWSVDFDKVSRTMIVKSVDQFSGEYACNSNFLQSFQCGLDKDAPNSCGHNCYVSGAPGNPVICHSDLRIDDEKTFRVISARGLDISLGKFIFVGDKVSSPSKFLGYSKAGWTFDRLESQWCEIPPYNAQLKCNEIPLDAVKGLCPGLSSEAEQSALAKCEKALSKKCTVIQTYTNTYVGRSVKNSTQIIETGCESFSTAVAK